MVTDKTVARLYSYYNKIALNNQKAEDLIEMTRREYMNALHIKKLSNASFKAQVRLLYQLPDKENPIVELHKIKSERVLHHRVEAREEAGFRMDFLERVSLTKADQTYYSAHYKDDNGVERHIYAPNLSRLNAILADLERIYNTKYERTSIKIKKYKAFIDRQMQAELEQYLI